MMDGDAIINALWEATHGVSPEGRRRSVQNEMKSAMSEILKGEGYFVCETAAELRARIAVLQREAKNADDDENITAKACEHSASELSRLLYWIDGVTT